MKPVVIIYEKKFPDKESETEIHGPFKNQFSAKQYFDVALAPYHEYGCNMKITRLHIPDMFDISPEDWMAQFSHGKKS